MAISFELSPAKKLTVAVGGVKSKPWKAVPLVQERLRLWARLTLPVLLIWT